MSSMGNDYEASAAQPRLNFHNLYIIPRHITSGRLVCAEAVLSPLSEVPVEELRLLVHGRGGQRLGLCLLAAFRSKIGFIEESGEKHEVREVHRHRQLDIDLANSTGVGRRRGQIVVRPHVHIATDDHLRQLEQCDRHGHHLRRVLPHADQRVVSVHHTVDAVVHDDEPARGGGVLGEGVPGVQQHGDVVVPVQEDEGFLAQHYEHRVAQLRQLREDEHPRPEAGHFVLLDKAWHTDGVVDAVVPEHVDELRQGPARAHDAEQRQRTVPYYQRAPELEPGPILHVVLPSEDECHVHTNIIKRYSPILSHPLPIIVMDKLVLKFENVRVVWCDVQVISNRFRLHGYCL
uniref:Uncharacterized protein n=1 Tax=Pectinophora gossypiella TaxID=13191 RepID=A0A1E1WP72_PECGO